MYTLIDICIYYDFFYVSSCIYADKALHWYTCAHIEKTCVRILNNVLFLSMNCSAIVAFQFFKFQFTHQISTCRIFTKDLHCHEDDTDLEFGLVRVFMSAKHRKKKAFFFFQVAIQLCEWFHWMSWMIDIHQIKTSLNKAYHLLCQYVYHSWSFSL